jgi:hypothetical protein
LQSQEDCDYEKEETELEMLNLSFYGQTSLETLGCSLYQTTFPHVGSLLKNTLFDLFFLSYFYCCAGWRYVVAFKKFLQYIKYIILEFTPSTNLLHHPPFLQ